jgi:hypothetical protein
MKGFQGEFEWANARQWKTDDDEEYEYEYEEEQEDSRDDE